MVKIKSIKYKENNCLEAVKLLQFLKIDTIREQGV